MYYRYKVQGQVIRKRRRDRTPEIGLHPPPAVFSVCWNIDSVLDRLVRWVPDLGALDKRN